MLQAEQIIYFITDRKDHDKLIYSSTKIKVTLNVSILDQYLESKKYAGLDCEFNGSRNWVSNLLLISIGDRITQFVIDGTSPAIMKQVRVIMNKHAYRMMFFGHNIKSDLNILTPHGIFIWSVFDTMIAHQRIHLGRNDITYNLKDVAFHYLKVYLDKKDYALDFLKMNSTSRFGIQHIIYSAGDIGLLQEIALLQKAILESRNQYSWFREVENPLVKVLSEMELKGIALYEDKWRVILEGKKLEWAKTEIQLDAEIDKLLGTKTKVRKKGTTVILGLFDAPQEVDNKNTKHRNYGSPAQVLKIFDKLGLPVPMFKEKGSEPKRSMREAAVQQYMIDNPKTIVKPMLKEYLNFKELQKFITSYGLKFLNSELRKKGSLVKGYKNSFTGKVQTIFKQCFTETGRLSSGDADEGYFNSQQIPAKKPIRECFGLTPQEIVEGYYLTTCDLSGAELIIMAALADDQHLYEIGADKMIGGKLVEGDLHSPIATKCWRAVYNYRKTQFISQYGLETLNTADPYKLDEYFTIYDSENKPYVLSYDFEITKKQNKQLRTDFKPMTFGVVYGLKANKGAQTLNISKGEAQAAIDVIIKEIPKTIAMVEQAARFAFCDGYVIFNNRSNNRRWFTPVVTAIERLGIEDRDKRASIIKSELPFLTIGEIEGAARNCRIQGTQADMIKESMVKVQRLLRKYPKEHVFTKKDFISGPGLVLSVHDELVGAHVGTGLGQELAELMTETANLYLAPYSNNIRMRADYHTLHTWSK